MKKSSLLLHFMFALLFVVQNGRAEEHAWPQGSGHGDFVSKDEAALKWSVAANRNIAWKITLPETGQSTPVVAGGKVFFTTLTPVKANASLGKDIVAWCCDLKNGDVLWKRVIHGKHPLRLSGCFGDSSSPPAVCDGQRVVFANASGGLACFDMKGKAIWQRDFLTVNRTLPFIHDGNVVLTRQIYPPEPDGNFPHKYKDSPLAMWTQLHAIDLKSGKDRWTTKCGVNMGCAILPQKLHDGRSVAVVGRGGGHGPPEKPDGVSLVDLAGGKTLWTLPLDGFMATMSYRIRDDLVHIFHKGEHLSVNALSGKIVKRVSIVDRVAVRRRVHGGWETSVQSIPGSSNRMITQTSNLLTGKFHFFRSYTRPWLGRVNVETGGVEYLELPLQIARTADGNETLKWFSPSISKKPKGKKSQGLKVQAIAPNSMKNSRGFVVMGDKRSQGNGWGHVAAPTPSVAKEHIYVPVQNGTVYVVNWNAEKLDENAISAINDLGPAGESYTRASLSLAGGHVLAHTIRELICIGKIAP